MTASLDTFEFETLFKLQTLKASKRPTKYLIQIVFPNTVTSNSNDKVSHYVLTIPQITYKQQDFFLNQHSKEAQ